jgi:hypothetical protein
MSDVPDDAHNNAEENRRNELKAINVDVVGILIGLQKIRSH